MAIIYVDPSAGSDGSGTQISPRNVLPTPGANDTVLLKSGTTLKQVVPGSFFAPGGVTLAEYGTGSKPVIDGSSIISAWTLDSANGVYYAQLAGNTAGNLTQDGVPMLFTAWSTNIATTAPLIPTGGYSFDYTNFRLYIKPTGGTTAGSVFVASGLVNLVTVLNAKGSTLRNLSLKYASKHGIIANNVQSSNFTGIDIWMCGGYRDTGINAYVGNGFEVSINSWDLTYKDGTAEEIYDSGFSPQQYGGKLYYDQMRSMYFENLTAKKCGMAGFEITAYSPSQRTTGIEVNGLVAEDIGKNCFSRSRTGYGHGIWVATDGRATSSLDQLLIYNAKVTRAVRGITLDQANGTLCVANSTFTDIAQLNGNTGAWAYVNQQIANRTRLVSVNNTNTNTGPAVGNVVYGTVFATGR